MRKKIIGVSVVIAILAILCAQSVAAQPEPTRAWTDKPQYKPGETGTLKISVPNEADAPVEFRRVNITYPWFAYNGKTGKWEGNETVTEGLPKWIDPGEAYYKEVEFTIPTDGRAISGTIEIDIETSGELISERVPLSVSSVSSPISIVAFDTWMTSLIVAVVVCTIILAMVVLLTTRKTRALSALVPRAPAPPPPKPKAKAE